MRHTNHTPVMNNQDSKNRASRKSICKDNRDNRQCGYNAYLGCICEKRNVIEKLKQESQLNLAHMTSLHILYVSAEYTGMTKCNESAYKVTRTTLLTRYRVQSMVRELERSKPESKQL